MKRSIVLLGLALGLVLAGAAGAATKGAGLTPGGRTIAGPGTVTIAPGASEQVYTHPGGGPSDICLTIVATGRGPLGANVTGASNANIEAPPGGSEAVCVDDVTLIQLFCMASVDCTGQWRVDDN